MIAGSYDILAEEGSTLTLQFEYQDESGNPVNITSNSNIIEFTAKRTSTKTDTFMFKILSNGNDAEGSLQFPDTENIFGRITKTGGTVGSFLLSIKAETMDLLSLGIYFYSLRLLNDATVTPLCKGRLIVESKV